MPLRSLVVAVLLAVPAFLAASPADMPPTPTPSLAAEASATPVPSPARRKPRKFVKPPNPEILVTHAVVNGARMWQVEVLEGKLGLKNFTVLRKGASMPLTEGQIEWTIGQIVIIGADGVKAGGKEWPAGTKLFVDERGMFLPVWEKPGKRKPRAETTP